MLLVLGALELSDKVQTYGAYAGFASVLGLAVLSLLYFGQARELRRLREWAGRAPERAAELQERAQAEVVEAQKRVVAQPAVRPPAATTAAAATAATTAGAGAAGAAAPAIPAVPAAKPGAPGALAVPPSTAAGAAAASAPAGAAGAPGAPGAPPAPPVPAGAPGAPATPPPGTDQPTVVARPTPATPAPTGGGTSELKLPVSAAAASSTQDSGETAVPLRRVSAAATLPPRTTGGGGAGGSGTGPSREGRGPGGRGGPLAIIGGIVAVLIVGILVATQLLGGDDEPVTPNAITTAAPALEDTPREQTTTTEEPEVSRGSVSVAVLNGTTITGLARGAANKIEATGYQIAKVGDNSVQTVQTSSVQFVEGSRRAAEDVARIVGIPQSALAPMDQGTRVVAGEDAAVVVIVGADQSQ